jgi:hypothetical protein
MEVILSRDYWDAATVAIAVAITECFYIMFKPSGEEVTILSSFCAQLE